MPHILHATDFSQGGDVAFAHALALALAHQADLTLLHVGDLGPNGADWSRFPGVRPRLIAWGLLPDGAGKAEVARRLGVRVRKTALGGDDPARAILREAEAGGADLLVIAGRGPGAASTLARRSVSRPVARAALAPTLVIPEGAPGFVAPGDGASRLRRILVAVDRSPDPGPALTRTARLLGPLGREGIEVELLHVGPEDEAQAIPPAILGDALPAAQVRRLSRTGDPATEIALRAEEIDADLIVLATEGRRGLIDALRGSVTERVLSRATRAVLACPAV